MESYRVSSSSRWRWGWGEASGPDAKAPMSTSLQNDMEVLVLGMLYSQLSSCDFGWPGWSRGQFLSWGK